MLTIEYIDDTEDVYDITVEDNHNFFANDTLVHNCNEVLLFSDEDHTFTCVLSSMVVANWDAWCETDAVYWATIFLDCVASEFIERGKHIPGLERAIRFTEKGRALGLGQMGFHTLLQNKMIPFESFDAHMLSQTIAARIWEESERASRDMAVELGEPEWCKGLGLRNTHRIAYAPTKSCVSAKTKIRLASGETVSVEEILNKNGITV